MPLARAVPRTIAILIGLAAAACANAVAPMPSVDGARMPGEVRSGFAEMAIQRVESDVSRAEVAAAIEPMIANAPICFSWPALWMEQVRRNSFVARYDLMARDWGEDAASSAQQRMDEFVEMGSLTSRAATELDARAVEYTLTADGERQLSGVLEPGRRPNFCVPAERRLVSITEMEWGQFECGSLRVRFTHIGEDWPSWARSDTTRARLASTWPAVGVPAPGSVSLSRQWFRQRDLPPGRVNGALRSVCLDSSRQQVVGSDLTLSSIPIE